MTTSTDRYLCFNLGKEEFAIPLLTVREVIGIPEVTPIPQMPSHFLGMMNLRGSVISIMDLRVKLGIKPTTTEETSIIILDLKDFQLGVVVDCVNSVVQLNPDQISEKPHMENTKTSDSIQGVFRKDEKLVLMLDISKALSLEDKGLVNKNNKAAA